MAVAGLRSDVESKTMSAIRSIERQKSNILRKTTPRISTKESIKRAKDTKPGLRTKTPEIESAKERILSQISPQTEKAKSDIELAKQESFSSISEMERLETELSTLPKTDGGYDLVSALEDGRTVDDLMKFGFNKKDISTAQDILRSTIKISSGERVDKEAYESLSSSEKKILDTGGLSELETFYSKNMRLDDGKWVKRDDYVEVEEGGFVAKESLSPEELYAYNRGGVKWLEDFYSKNMRLEDGNWVEKKDYIDIDGRKIPISQWNKIPASTRSIIENKGWGYLDEAQNKLKTYQIEVLPSDFVGPPAPGQKIAFEGQEPGIYYDVSRAVREGVDGEYLLAIGATPSQISEIKSTERLMGDTLDKIRSGGLSGSEVIALDNAMHDLGINVSAPANAASAQVINIGGYATYVFRDDEGETITDKERSLGVFNSQSEEIQRQIADLYMQDKYKGSYFGGVVAEMGRAQQEGEILGNLAFMPVTAPLTPVAKQITGQRVSPMEWAIGGIVGVLDIFALGGASGMFTIPALVTKPVEVGALGLFTTEYVRHFGHMSPLEKGVYGGLLGLGAVSTMSPVLPSAVSAVRNAPRNIYDYASPRRVPSSVLTVDPTGLTGVSRGDIHPHVAQDIFASAVKTEMTPGMVGRNIILNEPEAYMRLNVSPLQRVTSGEPISFHATGRYEFVRNPLAAGAREIALNPGRDYLVYRSPQAQMFFTRRGRVGGAESGVLGIIGEPKFIDIPIGARDVLNIGDTYKTITGMAKKGEISGTIQPVKRWSGAFEHEFMDVGPLRLFDTGVEFVTRSWEGKSVPLRFFGVEKGAKAPTVGQMYKAKSLDILHYPGKVFSSLSFPNVKYGFNLFKSNIRPKLADIYKKADVGTERVTAIIRNDRGEVLLTRMEGQNSWGLPGGGVSWNPRFERAPFFINKLSPFRRNETLMDALSREVRQETGLHSDPTTGLKVTEASELGTIRGSYQKRGRQRDFVIYDTKVVGKEVVPDIEIAELKWWKPGDKLNVDAYVEDALRLAKIKTEGLKTYEGSIESSIIDYEKALKDNLYERVSIYGTEEPVTVLPSLNIYPFRFGESDHSLDSLANYRPVRNSLVDHKFVSAGFIPGISVAEEIPLVRKTISKPKSAYTYPDEHKVSRGSNFSMLSAFSYSISPSIRRGVIDYRQMRRHGDESNIEEKKDGDGALLPFYDFDVDSKENKREIRHTDGLYKSIVNPRERLIVVLPELEFGEMKIPRKKRVVGKTRRSGLRRLPTPQVSVFS